MIVEKVTESKMRKIKAWPVNTNRASDLGNPCIRYHVLNRTRWQEKALHDVGLQYVFDMGSEIERIVLRELDEAGIQVVEQQRSFEWKEYNITGHVDGKIIEGSKVFPLEIKSCSPFVFKMINTIDDLKRGKYFYLRKYPTQLNLYMLMDGHERGVFIFKDKNSGQLKEIWMDLDYELGEETLRRAEAINAHLAAGTVPEGIYDDAICSSCAFTHICLPDRIGKEVEMIDSTELEELIDRWHELKPIAKEYDEIDEQIKKAVEGRDKLLVGPYFITGKYQERVVYNVPAEVKQQYKDVSRFWKRSIIRIDNAA